jgi:hypothetical protein
VAAEFVRCAANKKICFAKNAKQIKNQKENVNKLQELFTAITIIYGNYYCDKFLPGAFDSIEYFKTNDKCGCQNPCESHAR